MTTPPPPGHLFSELAKHLNPNQVAADIQRNLSALLQSTAPTLHLVSREEFEVQQALLARLRNQVDLLARQVALLEHPSQSDMSQDESCADS